MSEGHPAQPVHPPRPGGEPCQAYDGVGLRPASSALAGSPASGFGLEHDARARYRIRSGIVVTQRDSELSADVGEFRRPDSPLRAGELHGAGKPRRRRAQSVPRRAGVQDATVERRVVRGNEGRAVEPGTECGPQLGEGRRVAYVFPTQAMKVGRRRRRSTAQRPSDCEQRSKPNWRDKDVPGRRRPEKLGCRQTHFGRCCGRGTGRASTAPTSYVEPSGSR